MNGEILDLSAEFSELFLFSSVPEIASSSRPWKVVVPSFFCLVSDASALASCENLFPPLLDGLKNYLILGSFIFSVCDWPSAWGLLGPETLGPGPVLVAEHHPGLHHGHGRPELGLAVLGEEVPGPGQAGAASPRPGVTVLAGMVKTLSHWRLHLEMYVVLLLYRAIYEREKVLNIQVKNMNAKVRK